MLLTSTGNKYLTEQQHKEMPAVLTSCLLAQVQNSTVDQTAPPPFGQDMENLIVVPFCVESPLSGVGVNSSALTYRKVFQVNQTLACSGCRLLLHIERADHEATVYLNKVSLASQWTAP